MSKILTFLEAMAALKKGKKIRKRYWAETNYIYLDKNNIINGEDGHIYKLTEMPDNWEEYYHAKIL